MIASNGNLINTKINRLLNTTKKALKIFDPKTQCTKKPFGYRVAQHGYLLISCQGLFLDWCATQEQ